MSVWLHTKSLPSQLSAAANAGRSDNDEKRMLISMLEIKKREVCFKFVYVTDSRARFAGGDW